MPVKKDYAAICAKYISDILDGTIPACKWTKLAAQRHLNDLAKQDDPTYPFRFDQEKASRVCRYVDQFPHVKGVAAKTLGFKLEPWEVFLISIPFGWINKVTGLRRFRRTYSEIAKGNGKSPLMSAICSYMAFADNEPGAEVYTAATSRAQARVVFDVTQAMLRKMPGYTGKRGIEVAAHSVNQLKSNSFIRPLSSEAKGVEGINPYFICVDELHAHDSRDLYDNLDTANGKRKGSMLWVVTTAGDNRYGVCYEVRKYATEILEGTHTDDTVFAIIYTVDDEDLENWVGNVDVWRKANPNWGVSVDPEEIAAKAHAAAQDVSKQAAFLTKHLNCWVNAYSAWMNNVKLLKCADPQLYEENFIGWKVVIGTDLAAKLDLIAEIRVFWNVLPTEVIDKATGKPKKENKIHYYVFGTYWCPDARIDEGKNPKYQGWKTDGWLQSGGLETNNFDLVEDSIREQAAKYEVMEVCVDPWQATSLINHLQGKLTVVQVDQNVKNLSDPMKELEAAIYDGRFHYNGDPVLAWAFSNVVCKIDKNDNIYPVKEKPENKIDPVTALITAMNGVARYAKVDTSGDGVTIFGDCQKCGDLCIGKIVDDKRLFLCEKHGG